MTREELINQISQKISLVKQLYSDYQNKSALLENLKAELENLRKAKFPWFTGTVDDILANWIAIKGKILQIKQAQAEAAKPTVPPEAAPEVEVTPPPEAIPTAPPTEVKPTEEKPTIKKDWLPWLLLAVAILGGGPEEGGGGEVV